MADWIGRTVVICGFVTGVIAGIAGCSSGPKVVPKDQVANQISSKLGDAGAKPDSVSCPEDLKATVGATLNCELKEKGQSYGATVTVTSIEGGQAKFNIVPTVDKTQVAGSISDQVAQQTGQKPDSVSCPDNLQATPGSTLRCDLASSGSTYGVTVSFVNFDGGAPNWSFKVDDQPK
jgi:Domain of unknown function (DUF4333)